MATAIKIDKISSAVISGEFVPRNLKALNHLPARLDRTACLEVLSTLHVEWTPEALTASGKQIDIADVDEGLEYKNLSLSDRMRLKAALSQHGFISRGISRSRKI